MTATLSPVLIEVPPSGPVDDASGGMSTVPDVAPLANSFDASRSYFPAPRRFRVTRPSVDTPSLADIVARYCFGEGG